MDKNYADRVAIRRSLIQQHGARVHGCLPSGESAVHELYCFLLGTYLPQRYPTMFRVTADGKIFHNLVTGRTFPTVPATSDMAAALRNLGETVEDDIFLLHQTPEGHMSVAFVCCFPAGFDGSEKLGKLLADIHGPVPSYEKIGPSMEKFFAKLEVGKSVKRMNVGNLNCCYPCVVSFMQPSNPVDSGRFRLMISYSTATGTRLRKTRSRRSTQSSILKTYVAPPLLLQLMTFPLFFFFFY
jgi:hypothetical protein